MVSRSHTRGVEGGFALGGTGLEYRGDQGDEKFGVDDRITAVDARARFFF